MNSLTPQEERFFVRLIMKADDYGRYYASSKVLRPALFPLQLESVREADIPRWIAACEKAGLVRRYSNGKKEFVEIVNFGQRQRSPSKFPNPDDCQMPDTCPADDGHLRPYAEAHAEAQSKTDELESSASAIYAVYPKKVGRKKAIDAIMKAIGIVRKRPGTIDAVMWLKMKTEQFAAARIAAHLADPALRKYTPHPSTWFNEGRYDDDPAEWGPIGDLLAEREPTPEDIAYGMKESDEDDD
ncbi:MAG TPA: hypothetical protein VD994_07650 [Prosthecobacter sp.]|nr:hypothetical protein [Prosthecobacter sp.]